MEELEVSCLQYGYYAQHSKICMICTSTKSNDINLLRATGHLSYKEIATKIGLPVKEVERHFCKHFILKPTVAQAIAVKEHIKPEAQEIITKILDGEVDLVSAVKGVLKSKAETLLQIKGRIERLEEELEEDSFDVDPETGIGFDKSANYTAFNKLVEQANKYENAILDGYKVIDNKFFNQDDLVRAITEYKLNYLSKVLDSIVIICRMLESRGGEYKQVITELKFELAKQFDVLEAEVLSSNLAKTQTLVEHANPDTDSNNDSKEDGKW